MTSEATGLTLRARDGATFLFDPGALCLELLVTGGPGELAVFETLHRPTDLADWLGRSRLGLDPERVAVTPEQLHQARQLRDHLWELARSRVRGHTPPATPLRVLNEVAAQPPLAPRLTPEGTRDWAHPLDGARALATVARDAVTLFTGPYRHRIRQCGAEDCSLLFVDVSRPGRRRWCSMERCGNRHKVRALRARREREEGAGP
ncbi:CGNR zinc finger domain-containing protein [Streptomyces sp. NPDC005438]|uniref:CGNR zinc finger domain-containing protein n=1 Tax=Streptomyces sp. NPDC005438 TaxID=3156880 RepID=UPI0033B8BC97